MRLILIGPPGSGKGTQAKLLSQKFGLSHFGTGDILREAVRQGTPAGKLAKPYVALGQLVPDEVVNQMIAERFGHSSRPENFVMDGYPRTLSQAVAFGQILGQNSLDLDSVVLLVVSDEEILRRLTGRWICPNCKDTFHTVYKPPRVAGVCDECGTALIQREDDKEETVRRRLQVYHQSNVDLLAHYRSQGLLKEVSGQGDIDMVNEAIIQVTS
jgi:adenylate kinase